MKLPLNRSYQNGRVRPGNVKHRLSELMRVLRRSVESATTSLLAFAKGNPSLMLGLGKAEDQAAGAGAVADKAVVR